VKSFIYTASIDEYGNDLLINFGTQFVTTAILYFVFDLLIKRIEEADDRYDNLLAEIQALQSSLSPLAETQST